jgi:prophage antirepressor-like protein
MAEKFRDDIFTNILPCIRKTGEYNVNKNDKEEIKILNEEITQFKNNQRNIKYSKRKAIYIINHKCKYMVK